METAWLWRSTLKSFFDNIGHSVLKACWVKLLGHTLLPRDHYNIFLALTENASKIDRGECLRRLGINPRTRDRDLPRPLGTVKRFRELRSSGVGGSKLVVRHVGKKGIPQGTPISPLAANISMLEFDTELHAACLKFQASYRRCSDDILLICPPQHASELKGILHHLLRVHTPSLEINSKKTEVVRFATPGPVVVPVPPRTFPKPLQYLGFTFDGRKILIRGGTLSRYFRRMAGAVRLAKNKTVLARANRVRGRFVPHKRDLLSRFTHLGNRNFVTGYARESARSMGTLGMQAIRHQLARHPMILQRMLDPKP